MVLPRTEHSPDRRYPLPTIVAVLITGPQHRGIGAETAISLSHAHPATSSSWAGHATESNPQLMPFAKIDPSIKVKFVEIDLASLSSVRKGAQAIMDDDSTTAIDAVINNAAIMASLFELSPDGHEMQLAAGYLGHFVLTNRILPKILASRTSLDPHRQRVQLGQQDPRDPMG